MTRHNKTKFITTLRVVESCCADLMIISNSVIVTSITDVSLWETRFIPGCFATSDIDRDCAGRCPEFTAEGGVDLIGLYIQRGERGGLNKHRKRCKYDKHCKYPKYCKIWQNHLHHLDTQFVAGIVDQYLFSFQTCVAISSFTIALPVSFLLDCDPAPLASCLK